MLAAILIIFFVLLFAGAPIAFSMGFACIPFFVFTKGAMGLTIVQRMYTATDSFTLCAMPFFMLAGGLMEATGITENIVNFAGALVGHIRGGMAHTTTIAGVLMAGVSGSGNADVAALGALLVPAMRKSGYDPGYSIVCISTAGGIGPIIPPSITMVILASITSLSTGKLFMAGIIPGLIIAACYMGLNYIYAKRHDIPVTKFVGFKALGKAFLGAFTSLMMPIIIIGGILFGIFTATEAGVAAVIYGAIYGLCSKRFDLKIVYKCLISAVKSTAGCMFVIQISTVLSYIFTSLKLTKSIEGLILRSSGNIWGFFGIIFIICLIAGMFIDSNATMMMLVPILLPISRDLGIPDLQFSMVLIISLLTGGITPPVGLWLYIVAAMDGTPAEKSFKYVPPFLACAVVTIIILILVPGASTFIPSLTS